jgi:hypothetical protein
MLKISTPRCKKRKGKKGHAVMQRHLSLARYSQKKKEGGKRQRKIHRKQALTWSHTKLVKYGSKRKIGALRGTRGNGRATRNMKRERRKRNFWSV